MTPRRPMIEAWYVGGKTMAAILCRRCSAARLQKGEQNRRARNAAARGRAAERAASCDDCGRTRYLIGQNPP